MSIIPRVFAIRIHRPGALVGRDDHGLSGGHAAFDPTDQQGGDRRRFDGVSISVNAVARAVRLTEIRSRTAKSVFHFDAPGSVAKSTHAGLPWFAHVRRHVGTYVHFWPFDGWEVPHEEPAIVEVICFPAEIRPPTGMTPGRLRNGCAETTGVDTLATFLEPGLVPPERRIAEIEGGLLGTISPVG